MSLSIPLGGTFAQLGLILLVEKGVDANVTDISRVNLGVGAVG